jgi:hypothetical protein
MSQFAIDQISKGIMELSEDRHKLPNQRRSNTVPEPGEVAPSELSITRSSESINTSDVKRGLFLATRLRKASVCRSCIEWKNIWEMKE